MEIWQIVLVAIAASTLPVFIIYSVIFFRYLKRKDDKEFDEVDLHGTHYEPCIEKINDGIKRLKGEEKQTISMQGRGGKTLYADYFYRGATKTAVLVHGFHSTPYNNFVALAPALLDKGYNVLFVFQRSHKKSEGNFITLGQKEQYDILDWIELMAKDERVSDILVYGTSMGATTVGYMADKVTNPKVKVLCMDCGFTSFYEQLASIFKRKRDKILGIGLPTFWFWGLITGTHLFRSTTKSLKNAKRPVCFIHGEADYAVPQIHSIKNYNACTSEKKLITVADAGHTSSLLVGGKQTIDELFEFIDKYI